MKANFNIEKNVHNSRSISALSTLRKLQGLGLVALFLLIGSLQAWGLLSVTYTTSSGSPSASGNTITGATASFSDKTNQNNHTQMLASGNMTLTLTSLGGINISNITLSMKSNSSKGAGTLCYSTDGGSNWTYLVGASGSGVKFNNDSWYGSWSTSYVDVSKDVTLSDVTQLKIKIDATANSLYCQSFKLTYTAGAASTYTVTIAKNENRWGSVDKSSVTNVANNTSISASSNVLTVGETTVTATPAAADANYTYAFNNWAGIPVGGKVTSDVAITANFTRTERTLTNYRTSCSDPSCDEPTSLTKGAVTSTSVGLTITDPANTGSYEIYYNTTGTAPSSGTGASATYNITNPTVTGLLSGVTYYMWVRSKCDESTQSNWVALTGSTVTTTCGDPSNLSASSVIQATTGQNGGVTLSWDGDPNNYELYWHQSSTAPDAGQSPSLSVDGAKTYKVTGLTAGTYYWWVRSNCGSGKGSWVGGSPFTIKGIKVGGTTPVNFGTVNQNSLVEDKFITVTGVGLESGTNITASMSSGSPFSLDPTSVAYDASGTHVNISASTATAGTFNQTLTLSYGGTYTATVTVMMTVQAVYTVTYVHHDKGTFSGVSTTQYVPTNNNTITLPTVTDVSCGFYDTFEGWITGSEYAESSDKPATVYAGGSSYTVTGNVTLRALYSKCEGAGGSVYRKVTSTAAVTNGTYILVSNTTTPRVYSGHEGSNTYGSSISGLTADGDDYSSTLPSGAVQTTITIGTGVNAGKFAIYNGSKYLNYTSGNNLHTADAITYLWKLTDGSDVNSKSCPAGVLCPDGYATRVLQCNTSSSNRFACHENSQSNHVFLYQLIDKCTKSYATNPSCEKPVGVHVRYNANTNDASLSMSCSGNDWSYKVEDAVNKYPKLASSYSFCTNATRDEYTLIGWNTQANGLGTTYEITHSYSSLPVTGELDGENWVTLNLYAMWAPAVSFNLGNATGGTGVPAVVEADGGFMLPTPTAEQLGVIPCGYSFYGWSESSVVATNSKPALFMPGTKYTGAARTLYAVYRLAGEGGGDQYYFTFEVDSKTYCITRKHANYDRFVVEETTTGLEFGLDNGYLYYMDNDARVYVYWAGSRTTVTTTSIMPNNNAYKTTFVPGANGTTIVTPATSGRYLQMPESNTDRAYYTTTEVNPTLVEATSYTYATNPSCETTATLAFVTNGGTLNYPDTYDENSYVDLRVGTNVYLPTATYAGEWEFEGWMKGSELPSQDYSPEGMSNFYTVTLNTTTYSAAPAGTTTFYAIFSKTVNDNQFDPVNGGTYKLFAIMADGTKKYMPTWDGTQTTLSPVTSCASTGDYTITPGTGDHAGQYKITHGTYTLGVKGEGDTQFKNDANAWWDIEPSTSGKGTWRIKVHGSSTLCMALSGTGFFSNSIISGFVNSPSQPGYRDMEIGECIYTEYTSTPENIPYITITGSPVKITSTNGERVYAPTKLHIEAHNFSTTRTIRFSATNGFATNPASVNTGANGAYSGDIDIYYQPTSNGDGSIVSSVLTASQIAGPAAEQVSQTFSAIRGRNMPANFVIAAKVGEQWYAMPDDKSTTEAVTAVPIEVNDPDAPTAASLVPHNVEWSLSDVVSSNDRPKDKVYFYETNKMKDDGITPWHYALYAGLAPTIGTYGQVSGINGTSSYGYEWGLTTTDLCAYTISNANVGKNISINTSGNFGTHAANIASSTLYLLPITAYYETAQMQVLEWKANSVVIMYTGTQTTATTKVGDNSASSAQTLSSQKLTHGIYELTTSQALTANAGQPLKVSFGGGAEIAIVTIPIIINGEVTADADHASEDVIIVNGGKLTADATKYNFRNIYVYGGGKLKMASGSQLGVNNIILRAGGVTTNGSGGNATYAYVYPQVELGGELSSTQTNIKYEYVTDYDHWYHLCLPFNAALTSIHYPQEYYGSNVRADNSGSWIIKRYDGATRATGDYNAWKDIENDSPAKTEVTAGVGYIFWGAPKKVTIGGDQQRQAWGIQRMTMAITSAAAATTAETNDKNISVDSYRNVNNPSNQDNDRGWNLVGNPYMVNLTGLSSESLIAGQLVHTETVPWDGKWRNNGDGVRYVTIPDNHFDSYVAKTASVASGDGDFMPGRAFFVQITEGASTLTFAAANRASLTPARFAQTTQTVDIETGIVMSDKSKHDEVNFWIKDGKTEAYEFNADYPKTPNKTNFNIYGVHQSGNLSWVAISPAIAESDMAIGYQVPAAGDYTLSLSEKYIAEEIESVFVTDHGVSPELTTDLMVNTYSFTVHQAETNNERFTVSIKVREEDNTPTDIGNSTVDTHAVKFIRDDKMYILRNGLLYDATGKRVTEINK